jgi:hypothetical protein
MRRTACVLVLVAGCGSSDAIDVDAGSDADAVVALAQVRLADLVVDAPGAGTSGFADPTNAVNGVHGGGAGNGSVDVYSLAYLPAANQSITLGWTHGRLANGPGDDLAIFENPFELADGTFMDLIVVEVSRDGEHWRELAHHYDTADETVYVRDAAAWVGFAGKTPVLLDTSTNPVDPFDHAAAGGDAFDLDSVVGDDDEAAAIRADGVTQVRLWTAPAKTNPDTGAPYVHDAISNGADIDGMFGRYVYPRQESDLRPSL